MENVLGEFLEELRGKMSLREASAKSGISHTYIRDIELGMNRKTKSPIKPSVDTLKRLAEAYNYPYEELMKKAGYLNEFTDEEQQVLDKLKNNAVPIDQIAQEHEISVRGRVLNDQQKQLFLMFINTLVNKEKE